MSDFEKIDIMLGNKNINPIERELAKTIEGSINCFDTESNSHFSENSSHDNEIRDFSHENPVTRQDRFLEFMKTFSNEINAAFPRDGLLDVHNAFSD